MYITLPNIRATGFKLHLQNEFVPSAISVPSAVSTLYSSTYYLLLTHQSLNDFSLTLSVVLNNFVVKTTNLRNMMHLNCKFKQGNEEQREIKLLTAIS